MQEIIVYAIILCSLVYVARHLYKAMTRSADPCEGCPGCDIKKELLKNRKNPRTNLPCSRK